MRVHHYYHLWVLQSIVSHCFKVVTHYRWSHNIKFVIFQSGECLSILQSLIDQLVSLSHDLYDSQLVISVYVSNKYNSQFPYDLVDLLK